MAGSFNDIFPVDLIQRIFLRVPTKHLARLRCVSKLWKTLISDANFAKSHFELSLQPPSHRCIFISQDSTDYRSIDIDALSLAPNAHAAAATITHISPFPPLMETDSVPDHPCLLVGSCRGFIALYQYPHFLILWNPLTSSHKRISCHHIPNFSTLARRCFSHHCRSDLLFGFGYDISRDDFFVLLSWFDHAIEDGERFEFFSLRSNSWKSLDHAAVDAIPLQLRRRGQWAPSVFFNGAIHWLHHGLDDSTTIFVLDTRERWSFWEIPVPLRVGVHYPCFLMVLGGCLAIYYDADDDNGGEEGKTEIWVMKQYNWVWSWTMHEIPSAWFSPVCLSDNGDFIGFDVLHGMSKYDSGGKLLMCFAPSCVRIAYESDFTVYTESLITLPDDSDSGEKEGSSSSRRMKVI